MIAWLALILIQSAPVVAVQEPGVQDLPDWARLNPYGYERLQCSPLARPEGERLQTCQNRIRQQLAEALGDALPAGLIPFAIAPAPTPPTVPDGVPAQVARAQDQGPSGATSSIQDQTAPQEATP